MQKTAWLGEVQRYKAPSSVAKTQEVCKKQNKSPHMSHTLPLPITRLDSYEEGGSFWIFLLGKPLPCFLQLAAC